MKVNIKNLKILRRELPKIITQKEFDMSFFRREGRISRIEIDEILEKPKCGTVGCMLGWSPTIKGLKPVGSNSYMLKFVNEDVFDFEAYVIKFFGIKQDSDLWDYLFSTDWALCDNTLEGALIRLDNVIEGLIDLDNENYTRCIEYYPPASEDFYAY